MKRKELRRIGVGGEEERQEGSREKAGSALTEC